MRLQFEHTTSLGKDFFLVAILFPFLCFECLRLGKGAIEKAYELKANN